MKGYNCKKRGLTQPSRRLGRNPLITRVESHTAQRKGESTINTESQWNANLWNDCLDNIRWGSACLHLARLMAHSNTSDLVTITHIHTHEHRLHKDEYWQRCLSRWLIRVNRIRKKHCSSYIERKCRNNIHQGDLACRCSEASQSRQAYSIQDFSGCIYSAQEQHVIK